MNLGHGLTLDASSGWTVIKPLGEVEHSGPCDYRTGYATNGDGSVVVLLTSEDCSMGTLASNDEAFLFGSPEQLLDGDWDPHMADHLDEGLEKTVATPLGDLTLRQIEHMMCTSYCWSEFPYVGVLSLAAPTDDHLPTLVIYDSMAWVGRGELLDLANALRR